jgi:hypothetical protein
MVASSGKRAGFAGLLHHPDMSGGLAPLSRRGTAAPVESLYY